MKHPPYHLRINKAIDRYLLVDVLSLLATRNRLGDYHYYGLGGPFLEDFRLLGQQFSSLRMTSLESNEQTFRRQQFHRSSKRLTLVRSTLETFIATYSTGGPAIFWLDYTNLRPKRFQEFQAVLDRVADDSIVKITLLAELPDAQRGSADSDACKSDKVVLDEFQRTFDSVLPPSVGYNQLRPANFPHLLQQMLRIAAQKVLSPGCGRIFLPLHSCFYADGNQMYSLTGIVCQDENIGSYRKLFAPWPSKNLRWDAPQRLDMPVLSVKEQMALERHLPAARATGKGLRKVLGYDIEGGVPATERKLKQYAKFHRYYPYFAKVSIT